MTLPEIAQLLGNFGEFFGAIVVVATLFYLAKQVRQNTATVQANGYHTWVTSNLQVNLAATSRRFSETAARGFYDSKNLEPYSWFMFALWNHSAFQLIQATDYMYKMGAIDRALWESEINRGATHLELPGVRQWWDAGGRTQLAPDYVELLETHASTSVRYSWNADDGFVPDPTHSGEAPDRDDA